MFAWKLGRILYSFLTFPLPVDTELTLEGLPLYDTEPLPVIWASISSLAAISTSPEPVIRILETRVLKLLPLSLPDPLKVSSATSVDPLAFTLPDPEIVSSASFMVPSARFVSPDPLQLLSSSAHVPFRFILPDPDTRASISPDASILTSIDPDPLTHSSTSSARSVPSDFMLPEPLTPSPSIDFIVTWAVTFREFQDLQLSSGIMFSLPPRISVFTWARTSGSPSSTTLSVLPCFTVTVPGTPKLRLVNPETFRVSFFCAMLMPGTANMAINSMGMSFFICCKVKCYRNDKVCHTKVASNRRVRVL